MIASHGEEMIGADAVGAGQGLDRDVRDAEQDAGGGAEHHAVVVVGHAEVLAADQQRADHEHRALEGDHADQRVGRVLVLDGGQRDDQQHQAERGHADADPLAQADLEAEQPLGHHGHDHDAGGEHGLDDARAARRRARRRGRGRRRRRSPCRSRTTCTSTGSWPCGTGGGCPPWPLGWRPCAYRESPAAWRTRRLTPAECPDSATRVLVRQFGRDSSPRRPIERPPRRFLLYIGPRPATLSADRASLAIHMKIPSRPPAKLSSMRVRLARPHRARGIGVRRRPPAVLRGVRARRHGRVLEIRRDRGNQTSRCASTATAAARSAARRSSSRGRTARRLASALRRADLARA